MQTVKTEPKQKSLAIENIFTRTNTLLGELVIDRPNLHGKCILEYLVCASECLFKGEEARQFEMHLEEIVFSIEEISDPYDFQESIALIRSNIEKAKLKEMEIENDEKSDPQTPGISHELAVFCREEFPDLFKKAFDAKNYFLESPTVQKYIFEMQTQESEG